MSGQDASSPILAEEVDRNYEWALSEIQNFIQKTSGDSGNGVNAHSGKPEGTDAPQPTENASTPTLDNIARSFIDELNDAERQLLKETTSIPPHLDRKLLFTAREGLRRFLGPEETKALRRKVRVILP